MSESWNPEYFFCDPSAEEVKSTLILNYPLLMMAVFSLIIPQLAALLLILPVPFKSALAYSGVLSYGLHHPKAVVEEIDPDVEARQLK